MDGEVGTDRAQQADEAQVLHEHGIDAGFGEPHDCCSIVLQLGGEDERVERDVAADAALVEKGHDLGQCIEMQIRGPGAGVESAFEAEVDRVGAVFYGGGYTQPVAGWGEQLQCAALAERRFCEFRRFVTVEFAMRWWAADLLDDEAIATQPILTSRARSGNEVKSTAVICFSFNHRRLT